MGMLIVVGPKPVSFTGHVRARLFMLPRQKEGPSALW
jgi:hypothetical protein